MAQTPTVRDRGTLYAAVLSFVAGVLSTGFGIYNARLNNQIAAAQQRIEGHQKFAALVRDSLDALSDSRKASLSLAAIYAVAEDETEKRIVITIAAATHSADVQRVLTVLVNNDSTAKAIANDKNVTALIAEGAQVATPAPLPVAQASKASVSAVHGVGSVKEAASHSTSASDLRPPDNSAQADLLAALAKKSIGWVYYGKFGGVRSHDASECLPASATVPKPSDTIALCSARYLRATKPAGSLGAIVGIAQAGVPLHVRDVAAIPLSEGSRAIWLQVATD